MIIEKLVFNKHLEAGEKILFVVHRHWVRLVSPFIVIGFFGIVLPWILYFMGFNTQTFFWIAVIWSGFGIAELFQVWVASYSNVWLFTDMSIITIQWRGPFSNLSQRITYDDVEGLIYEINGFSPTVLRYGDVSLRLMSQPAHDLKHVMSPKRVEMELIKSQRMYHERKEMRDAGSLKEILSEMVATHMRSQNR